MYCSPLLASGAAGCCCNIPTTANGSCLNTLKLKSLQEFFHFEVMYDHSSAQRNTVYIASRNDVIGELSKVWSQHKCEKITRAFLALLKVFHLVISYEQAGSICSTGDICGLLALPACNIIVRGLCILLKLCSRKMRSFGLFKCLMNP